MLAYVAVLALAGVQALRFGATDVLVAALPYLAALVVLVAVRAAGPIDPDGPRAHVWIRGVASAGTLLAGWVLVRFAAALPAQLGAEHGFYRVKVAVTSPVGDHNTAAGLLLVGVVAAAVATATDRRWGWALGVTAAGMVATLSRGAAAVLLLVAAATWVATGASAAGSWLVGAGSWLTAAGSWLTARRRTAAAMSVAAVAVVVGLGIATLALDTSPPPQDAQGPITAAGSGLLGVSILGRADLAVRGVELGREEPLTGVGLGRFADHAADLPQPNDHAHQALAHAAAEGGVLLLVVTVGLPVLLAVRALRLPPSPLRELTLLGGGVLVAHAQLDILAGRIGYEVLLALLLGLAGAGGQLDSRPRPS